MPATTHGRSQVRRGAGASRRRVDRHVFLRKPPRGGARFAAAATALMPLTASEPSVVTFPVGGSSGGYQLVVVNKFGARYALGELAGAEGDSCSWKLNDAGSASFTIGTLDDHVSSIVGLARELQIWRNGRLLWWGPIVRPEADAKRLRVQCRQLEWYFDRVHVGRADRNNLLTNPSFETGDYTGWQVENTTPTVTSSLFIEGSYSVRLEQSTAQQIAYLYQVLDDYGATGVGSVIVVAAWFYIDPDAWLGEALGKRGLVVQRKHATTGEVLQAGHVEIDGKTPRGTWQRVETLVNMPPDAVEDIEVRLYSPGGVIYWDAISATLMESVSSVSSATDFTSDIADIFNMLVVHAQDTSFGKNDKNIQAGASTKGVRRERHYQMAEHPNVGESIKQFAEEGVYDWQVEITPNTRRANIYVPRRGDRKPEFRVYLYGDAREGVTKANIADDFRFSFDGVQAVNSVVVLGDGDGPDREEGGALDDSLFGGNVYEAVVAAPPESTINSLDAIAAERLSVYSVPEILFVTYLPIFRPGETGYSVSRDPIDNLHVGDVVPVEILYGWIQINDVDYRVVEKAVDMKRDLCSVTLNRAPA